MIPEACFVAVKDDLYLGYSALTVNDQARTQAGSAGRRFARSIAARDRDALKARSVQWRRPGRRRLVTSSGNLAMIAP